eukprot:gene29419-35510_t
MFISFLLLVLLAALIQESIPSASPTGQPTSQPSAAPFKVTYRRDRLINTYAGFTNTLYDSRGGDGVFAQYARLDNLRSLWVDLYGDLYIGESGLLRKLTFSSATISIVAGTLSSGSLLDAEMAATSVLTALILGVTGDSNGFIYYSDSYYHRVRRLDPSTGLVRTIAGQVGTAGFSGDGGQATSAQINYPYGIAVKGQRLAIADYNNHRIRMVDLSTGIISTIAGTGSSGSVSNGVMASGAITSLPTGIVASSDADTFLIIDFPNCMVRSIVVGGLIRNVAGSGVCGTTAQGTAFGNIAIPDAICGNTAVADSTHIFLRDTALYRVNIGANTVTLRAGGSTNFLRQGGVSGTSVSIGTSYGCAVATDGSVYIADVANSVIWKMNIVPAGTLMEVIVGYIGDVEMPKEYVPLGQITGMWENTVGDMYLVETDRHRVSMVRYSDGMVRVVAGTGVAWFADDGSDASFAPLSNPRQIAGDSLGNFYITDTSNNRVRRVLRSSNIISTIVGTSSSCSTSAAFTGAGTSCCLLAPFAIAIDAAANLYLSDNNWVVRRLSLTSNIISTIAGTGVSAPPAAFDLAATTTSFGRIAAIWVDPSTGYVYLADLIYNRIYFVWLDTIITMTWRFNLFAGTGTNAFSADGVFAKRANIGFAGGIAGDAGQNVFIMQQAFQRIGVIDKVEGRVYTYGAPSTSPSSGPTSAPSGSPTVSPASFPTNQPSSQPTGRPTASPSTSPSACPYSQPSARPKSSPTHLPTKSSSVPTVVRTVAPSLAPSCAPSVSPSLSPSFLPTKIPTVIPAASPTATSFSPTADPPGLPTIYPSELPTACPSEQRTLISTVQPTAVPTFKPTELPSPQPSLRAATLRILKAQFNNDGSEVYVTLNERTNAIVGQIYPCKAILLFASVELYSCTWHNNSQIGVLDVNSKLSLVIGGNISLVNSVNYSLSAIDGQTLLDTSIDRTPSRLLPADSPELPVIGRVTPSYLPFCSSWLFDLAALSGNLGRAWESLSFSVQGLIVNDTDNARRIEQEFLRQYSLALSVVNIGNVFLIKGEQYNVSIAVCNFVGGCQQRHILTQFSNDTTTPFVPPVVNILVGSSRPTANLASDVLSDFYASPLRKAMYSNDSLTIVSDAYSPLCAGLGRATASLRFTWILQRKFTNGTKVTVPERSRSKDSRKFVLSPFTLSIGNAYLLQLTVADTVTGLVTTSDPVLIIVMLVREVSVAISPAYSPVLLQLSRQPLILDASDSFDPNFGPSYGHGLEYNWS